MKVRKGRENSLSHGGRESRSSREIPSTTVSTKEGLLRNDFRWCPLTLKLLYVDSLLILTAPYGKTLVITKESIHLG